MALQMKLDELEAAEVNIKVSYIVIFLLIKYLNTNFVCRGSDLISSY